MFCRSAMVRYGYQGPGAIRMLAGKLFGDREAPKTAPRDPGGKGGDTLSRRLEAPWPDTATKARAQSEC